MAVLGTRKLARLISRTSLMFSGVSAQHGPWRWNRKGAILLFSPVITPPAKSSQIDFGEVPPFDLRFIVLRALSSVSVFRSFREIFFDHQQRQFAAIVGKLSTVLSSTQFRQSRWVPSLTFMFSGS